MRRLAAVVAIGIGLIAAVANAANLLFLDFFGLLIVLPYALGSFAGVGLVLALLRPGHAVGWLFLIAGASFALWFTLPAYSWRALVDAPGALPASELATWISSWIVVAALGSVLVGILLSHRSAPVAALGAAPCRGGRDARRFDGGGGLRASATRTVPPVGRAGRRAPGSGDPPQHPEPLCSRRGAR